MTVTGPGTVEPGSSATFQAIAHVRVTSADGTTQDERQDVTAQATWTASAGSVSRGILTIDCTLAGTSVSATAVHAGQRGTGGVTVKPAALTALTVAAPGRAHPGDTVSLTATATYGRGECKREERVTDRAAWKVSPGGTVTGGTLKVAPDTRPGAISVSATFGSLTSDRAVVQVIAPALTRLEVTASPSAQVCGTAEWRAFAYYSNEPTEAREVTDRASWSFAGPHTTVARNRVRAQWPNSTIVGSATFGGMNAQRGVTVGAIGRDVFLDASFTTVNVGESKKNVLRQFYCNGWRPDYRVVQGVRWRSAQPDRLACSPDGTCTGRSPGFTLVLWSYKGTTGAGRRVEVGGGHVAQLLRVACAPTQVTVGSPVQCQAFGVLAERPGIVADVSQQVTWIPGAAQANGGPPGTGRLIDVSARLCPPYCSGKGCAGKP